MINIHQDIPVGYNLRERHEIFGYGPSKIEGNLSLHLLPLFSENSYFFNHETGKQT